MAESRFFSINQLSHMPPPQWLIEGLFEVNSLVMLSGPPGSMKSFMALDWLLCMAAGLHWNDKQVVHSKVLYVLGEGRASLLKRIQAWAAWRRIGPERQALLDQNFRVTFDVPQLAQKSSVDNMLSDLKAENFEPQVVVVDTLSRSFVGFDENSQKDAGMWVDSAERLRALGMAVIFVHHTGKNTEFGYKYRGSSVLQGAVDTAFIMYKERKNKVVFSVSKQKDHEEGPDLYFEPVSLSPDPREEGSVALKPMIPMDERFTEEVKVERASAIDEIIQDGSGESNRRKGERLAPILGITPEAARKKIERRMEELGVGQNSGTNPIFENAVSHP